MKTKLALLITFMAFSIQPNGQEPRTIEDFFQYRGWKGNVSLKITQDITENNEYNRPVTVKYNFSAVGTVDIRDEEYDEEEGRSVGGWPNYDMMKQITDPQIVYRWEPSVTYSKSVTEFGETQTCSYSGVMNNPDYPKRGNVQIMLFGVDQYQIHIFGPSFMVNCGEADSPASPVYGYSKLLQLPQSGNVISGKEKIDKNQYLIEVEWNLTGYK